jgi:hypothetical protein
MRRYMLLLAVALAVVVTGCGGEASPTVAPEAVDGTVAPSTDSDPAVAPSPTQAGGASEDSLASPAPPGEAVCTAAAAEFPVEPGLRPVTEEDHTRGNDDASITLIEYSDFQ